MKDSSAPQAPNPEVTIPLQGAENRKTFDYQLGQMRTNTSGPTGSSTWTKTPTFDQAGYDAALAAYNPGSQGTWVPESTSWSEGGPVNGSQITTPGHWEGGTAPTGAAPNRDDFTNYTWTQTNTLSPEQQALYESNVKNTQQGLDLVSQMQGNINPLNVGLGGFSIGGLNFGGSEGGGGGDEGEGAPAGWGGGGSGTPMFSDMRARSPLDYMRALGTPDGPEGPVAAGGGGPHQESPGGMQFGNQGLFGGLAGSLPQGGMMQSMQPTASGDSMLQAALQKGSQTGLDQGLADAIYSQHTRYLDPQLKQQRDTMMAELADSGFVPGTPGYDRAMGNFLDTSDRAYGAARDSAITQGYSQGNTQTNQQQALAQILAGLQNQGFSQALTRQAQPINLLNALKGGNQVSLPSFGSGQSGTPNLGSTDIMGALNQQYQGQLGASNAATASNNATMGAIASLLAAFISDRRFKDVISRDGETPAGVPVYLWRYKGGKALFRGVMAQDLLETQPEAVTLNPDGVYSVNYLKVR